VIRVFDLYFLYRRFRLWQAGFRTEKISLPGKGSFILWRGGTSAVPVLLIHGLGGSVHQDFKAAACSLVPNREVICFDLPGYGYSKGLVIKQNITQHARFLLEVLDRLEIPKVHLIGNSMGGWISLKFAQLFPDRLEKLVLTVSAGVRFEPPPLNVFCPDDGEGLMRLLGYLTCRPPQKLPAFFVKDWLRLSGERRAVVKEMIESMMSQEDLMDDQLSEIRHPTLVLWGEKDRLIPVSAGRALVEGLPNATLYIHPDAGHLVFHECYEEMISRIEAFLD
jgi:abhydrolase domain-containing protein 6